MAKCSEYNPIVALRVLFIGDVYVRRRSWDKGAEVMRLIRGELALLLLS